MTWHRDDTLSRPADVETRARDRRDPSQHGYTVAQQTRATLLNTYFVLHIVARTALGAPTAVHSVRRRVSSENRNGQRLGLF